MLDDSRREMDSMYPWYLCICFMKWCISMQVREGTFLIGERGGGPGYFRNFLRKKSWPSHFPDWINAWPFTNT